MIPHACTAESPDARRPPRQLRQLQVQQVPQPQQHLQRGMETAPSTPTHMKGAKSGLRTASGGPWLTAARSRRVARRNFGAGSADTHAAMGQLLTRLSHPLLLPFTTLGTWIVLSSKAHAQKCVKLRATDSTLLSRPHSTQANHVLAQQIACLVMAHVPTQPLPLLQHL